MTAPERGRGARAIVKSALRSWDVSFECRAVWLLIESFSDRNGANAFPSMATLARISGHDPKWIKRRIRELREAAWLTSYTKPTPRGRVNVYVLNKPGIGPDWIGPKTGPTPLAPKQARRVGPKTGPRSGNRLPENSKSKCLLNISQPDQTASQTQHRSSAVANGSQEKSIAR